MKLYQQGKCGIRIRLTNEDLAKFEITVEDLEYESPRGKRVFHALFAIAKEELDFDTAGEKIYIQLFPTGKGKCDLFITKLEEKNGNDCFRFADFDSFYTAVSHTALLINAECWQDEKSGCFYVVTSAKQVPPLFHEFGERIKIPSWAFLRSRCRKLQREERI